jgi:hypothetical protein
MRPAAPDAPQRRTPAAFKRSDTFRSFEHLAVKAANEMVSDESLAWVSKRAQQEAAA